MIKIKHIDNVTHVSAAVTDLADSIGYCEYKIPLTIQGVKAKPTKSLLMGSKAHIAEEEYEQETVEFEPVTTDELIDENYCGSYEYDPPGYIPDYEYGGIRNGKEWRCDSEGVDEKDEFSEVVSNEMGFYFQTKTIPRKNKKWEIVTAARFDYHDQLDEGIQFSAWPDTDYQQQDNWSRPHGLCGLARAGAQTPPDPPVATPQRQTIL